MAVNVAQLLDYDDVIIGAEVLAANGVVLDFGRQIVSYQTSEGEAVEFPIRRNIVGRIRTQF